MNNFPPLPDTCIGCNTPNSTRGGMYCRQCRYASQVAHAALAQRSPRHVNYVTPRPSATPLADRARGR